MLLFYFTSLWYCTIPNHPSTIETGENIVLDFDGDGFTEEEGDCNDEDSDTSPFAEDASIDGIDQNCDGIDGPDLDQDGLVAHEAGGADCDDHDPNSTTTTEDPDCDGYPAWMDCDDHDPNSTTTVEDADCDGFIDQPCVALSFDGMNDIVSIHQALQLDNFTIEMWIKPPQNLQKRQIIFEANMGADENMLSIQITEECKLRAEIKRKNQNIRHLEGSEPICNASWFHIALVRESTEVRLFSAGHNVKNINISNTPFAIPAPIILGYTHTPHDLDAPFQGLIHSVHMSSIGLYDQDFQPQRQVMDEHTIMLWYLSEGQGDVVYSQTEQYDGHIDGATWVEECPFIYQ